MNFNNSKFLILLFFISALAFQNCGSGVFKATSSSSKFSFCKAQTQTTSPFLNTKLQVPTNSFTKFQKSSTNKTDLSVIVDVACLDNNEAVLAGVYLELSEMQSKLSKAAIPIQIDSHNLDLAQEDAQEDPCIIGISLNSKVSRTQSSVNDPLTNQQSHLTSLGYDNAARLRQAITKKVIVAVIDSGVEYTHDDLKNRMWTDTDGSHGSNIIDSTSTPLDDDGHGTHVAGIIAAQENNGLFGAGLTGSFVEIMAVKVLDSSGDGTAQGVYDGIQYAISKGADIINLSIESEGANAVLASGIRDAVNAGIVVTMAAGNKSQEMTASNLFAPAYVGPTYGGAISVASVNAETQQLSSFSNYSSHYVEIAAPGSDNESSGSGIVSTYLHNNYNKIRGTSQAAPMVASSAALLIGYLKTRNVNYTAESIERFIVSSGVVTSSALNSKIKNSGILSLSALSLNILNYFTNSSEDIFDGTDENSQTCQIN